MNLEVLDTFLAVVRLGNLNAAAGELKVSQSTVTARLNSLEAELGVTLLVRSRTGTQLTKEGYRFLEQAELVSNTWAAAKAQFTLPTGLTSLFSLACDPTLWRPHGAELVERIRIEHPEIAVEVWSAGPSEAQRWLESGLSDAAVLRRPLAGRGLNHRVLASDELVQYASVDRRAVRWDPDYVYVDYGPDFRAAHAEAFGAVETPSIAFSHPEWALRFLLGNGGSGYLPADLAREHVDAGQLFAVRGSPTFAAGVHLSWRDGAAPVASRLVAGA